MITKKLFYYCKKVAYLYVYMDDWEEFNETPLPGKEDFYSHLNGKILLMQVTHTKKSLEGL